MQIEGGAPRRRLRIVSASVIVLFAPSSFSFAYPLGPNGTQQANADRSQEAPSSSDVRRLEPDKPIEREMRGGESHTYEIALEAGQYLQVVVDQRGIDVVVALYGPDGKKLIEGDSPNGTAGPEPLSWITENGGSYRLEVRSLEKEAKAGRYEVRIVDLRGAREADRALAEALNLFNEVDSLGNKGKFAEAIPLAERALTLREKALGPSHPDVATLLQRLEALYYYKGDYTKAEQLAQRALEILEKTLGSNHPDVATEIGALAVLYKDKGDYAKAEPLFQRALGILERAFGPNDANVAPYVNGLARFYRDRGDYAKAEPLFQHALEIREKAFGPNHKDVAYSLYDFAVLYKDKGDYAKAEPLFQRALEIIEKALGPNHPHLAYPLHSLAELYRDKGDYAKAEPPFQHALEIWEKALGPNHPNVAASLNGLATLYRANGDTQQAVTFSARAAEISEFNLNQTLITGSERQKLLFLALREIETNLISSLHAQSAPNDSQALKLALTTLLRRKGRGMEAASDVVAILRRRANPKDQALFDKLISTRSQLATLTLRGPGRTNPDQFRSQLKQLEDDADKLEADLSSRTVEFRMQTQPVTIEAIQFALPKDAALIEFATYRPYDAKTKKNGPLHYVAYALAAQGQPRWVELGEAAPINSAVDSLRAALRDPNRQDVQQIARSVDEKVMQPVRKLLGDEHRVFLSPDGALNVIPFAALVDEKNHYLVRQYSFTYLTSGRDLLRLREKSQSRQAAMVVADPEFGGDTTPCVDRKLKMSKGAVDFSKVLFCPLPGTASEAHAIKSMMPEASMRTREQATEEAIKQASAPKILHIATHGFFLEDVAINPGTLGRDLLISSSQPEPTMMKVKNPLVRSGLALAGANLHKSGDDDGVLTALEVAGLDLWGTKLVVLSACDTGVGEVRNGDGVYGLRRALVLAGSETQVMSLWSVDDAATRDLMIEYYKRLLSAEGRGESLRQVQLKMLASKDRNHPYYWASFIQSGEWANLDGKR